jgi:hypothetical protein
MIMEAMRLSLVEHEEQQRREAATRAQSTSGNPDAVPVSGDAAVPPALPLSATQSMSISEPGSGSHTPISSGPSPAPVAFIELSAAAAQGGPSSTLGVEGIPTSHRSLTPVISSRNRTPSPTNPRPSDNLQPPNQSGSWRGRSSSPRPFSTIAAAMSATSTVTAILQGDEASSRRDKSAGASGSTTAPGAISGSMPAATSSPTPAVSGSPSSTTSVPSPNSHDSVNVVVKPERPQMSIQTESYASSIFSTGSTGQRPASPYEVLGSSPDSEFSREPLLGSTEPDTPTIPEAGLQEVIPSRVVGERVVE